MTRRETIVELARTLRDVEPAAIRPGQTRAGDPPYLQFSALYRAGSYAHLEQALEFMRSRRKQYAIAGCNLGQLHWHFTHRYLQSERRPLPARQAGTQLQVMWDGQWQVSAHRWEPCGGLYRVGDKGPLQVQVEIWHRDVRPERVQLAIDWLDQHLPAGLHSPDWAKYSDRAA